MGCVQPFKTMQMTSVFRDRLGGDSSFRRRRLKKTRALGSGLARGGVAILFGKARSSAVLQGEDLLVVRSC